MARFRRFVPLFALLTLALAAAAAQAECGGRPCIQVGTFNIEHFGNEERHPRTDAGVREIADLITSGLGLEVVVLQEIMTGTPDYAQLEALLRERGWAMAAGESGGTQHVVIAYRTDAVRLLEEGGRGIAELPVREIIDLGGPCRDDLRRPLAGRFQAGSFTFLLVGVHFKSKIEPRGAPAGCADRIRTEQVREMLRAADQLARAAGEDDVIVIGDFNSYAHEPPLQPLRDAGFRALTTPLNRAPASGALSYLRAPYRSLIDHAMVRPARTREWIAQSTVVWRPDPRDEARYVREVSDHAPVYTSFATDGR